MAEDDSAPEPSEGPATGNEISFLDRCCKTVNHLEDKNSGSWVVRATCDLQSHSGFRKQAS